ncbi:MAG TPA: MerR family transcriptional regulator [bacterium]|nr:MerR family transcriptional regulator [bacterium]
MIQNMPVEMKLGELSERSGIPARTIRLYVSKGLLPGPTRPGPGATYTREHLQLLDRIRQLQRQGMTLVEIRGRLCVREPEKSIAKAEAWMVYDLDSDVRVMVRAESSPWRLRKLQRALGRFQKEIKDDENGNAERDGRDL